MISHCTLGHALIIDLMPRQLAFDVLGDILIRKQQFDDVFAIHPRLNKLDVRDRALAFNLIDSVPLRALRTKLLVFGVVFHTQVRSTSTDFLKSVAIVRMVPQYLRRPTSMMRPCS